MEAKTKDYLQQEILQKFPGTDPKMDIDWDVVEISFKAGERQGISKGRKEVVEFVKDGGYLMGDEWEANYGG